jgi:hypothetical protein
MYGFDVKKGRSKLKWIRKCIFLCYYWFLTKKFILSGRKPIIWYKISEKYLLLFSK